LETGCEPAQVTEVDVNESGAAIKCYKIIQQKKLSASQLSPSLQKIPLWIGKWRREDARHHLRIAYLIEHM
jgi:hypothetical protein